MSILGSIFVVVLVLRNAQCLKITKQNIFIILYEKFKTVYPKFFDIWVLFSAVLKESNILSRVFVVVVVIVVVVVVVVVCHSAVAFR